MISTWPRAHATWPKAALIALAGLVALAVTAHAVARASVVSGAAEWSELRFADASAWTKRPAFDSNCEPQWTLTTLAGVSTGFINKAIGSMQYPLHVHDVLPAGKRLEVRSALGQRIALTNVSVLDLNPATIQLGVCRDDLEWLQRQSFARQAFERSTRPNDGLQILVSDIVTHVQVKFQVVQTMGSFIPDVFLGWGIANVTVRHVFDFVHTFFCFSIGTANVTVHGVIDMHVDLRHIEAAALGQCRGKFDVESISIAADGISVGLLNAPIRQVADLLVGEMGHIICYGDSVAAVAVYNSETSHLTKLRGVVQLLNAEVSARATLVNVLLWPFGASPFPREVDPNLAAVERARADIAKLKEVGIEAELGEGRFDHIRDENGDGVYHVWAGADGGGGKYVNGIYQPNHMENDGIVSKLATETLEERFFTSANVNVWQSKS